MDDVILGIMPIIGIRWWLVIDGFLYGVGNFSIAMSDGRICSGPRWHPGKPLRAGCLSLSRPQEAGKLIHSLHKGLDAPQRNCVCGIYATRDTAERPDYATHHAPWNSKSPKIPIIQGEVLLWGHVIEHRMGWRAQYAQVKAFHEELSCISQDLLYNVAETYHVPVVSPREIPL